MMFDPNAITTQQSQIQYQQPQQNEKDKGEDQKDTFSPFCYANVNMIHKIAPTATQTHNSTVNMSQLTDDKCYITQPFSYNYTLVNQNLLTQNITFKCEVCGLMFAHLSLLNHHKKVHHGQTDQGQAQQQQITVQVGLRKHMYIFCHFLFFSLLYYVMKDVRKIDQTILCTCS